MDRFRRNGRSRTIKLMTLDNVVALLDTLHPEVLATLGAGNIDSLIPILKEKYSLYKGIVKNLIMN